MSDRLPSLHRDDNSETELETPLEPAMKAALAVELQRLPELRPLTEFNGPVLNALTSGRDFDPSWRQLGTRLRWMALPLLIGLVGTVGLAQFLVPATAPVVHVQATVETPLPNPKLPPMPSTIPTTEPDSWDHHYSKRPGAVRP